ncbi:hypothetical protein ACQ4PT_057267 [Festuca glaucescens]
MQQLEEEIAETLSILETIFPPSFFDSMVHLMVHLPSQVRLGGTVLSRNMYPVERFLMTLKRYVRTRSHPEGSIAECYVFDESLTFCSQYLHGCETRYNRKARNDDGTNHNNEDILPYFSKNVGRALVGNSIVTMDNQAWLQAHNYVLNNSDHMEPFMEKHFEYLSSLGHPRHEINRLHHETFHQWFRIHVVGLLRSGGHVEDEVIALAEEGNMSKRGRDDMEAIAKKYEENRATRIRENIIKMQSLNMEAAKRALNMESKKKPLSIESILEGCGVKNSKRNKVPEVCSLIASWLVSLVFIGAIISFSICSTKFNFFFHKSDPEQGKVEKEVRKFTRKETLWARANEKLPLIKLDCNKLQQPIGPGSKEFPAVVTTLIRTKQFPVNLPDWRHVPVEHKEKLLDDLSAIYVMDEWLKAHSLLTAAKKWRAFKCDLKTKAFKSDDPLKTWTMDELLARGDIRVDPEQWKWLVKYWLSEEGQESSNHGKQSRSKVVTPHTTGSKSFARAGHEWGKELGRDLSRHELFMKTHTRKNGDPLDKAIPKMNALAEAAIVHPELLEKPIEKGDLFSHVFGREPRGYVRGVGLGPTPASLGIDGHHTCTSTRIQMARRHSQNMEDQNTLLMNALEQVFEELGELKEIVKAGQGNGAADHVSTPTPEYGSDPSPPMPREVANEYNDHDVFEDMTNTPIVEVV